MYILVLKPQAIVRQNGQEIIGISVESLNFNLSVYADNLIVLVRDQAGADQLMKLLEDHGLASNGKMNYKKSMILMIGDEGNVRLGEADIIAPSGQVTLGMHERGLGILIEQELNYIGFWLALKRSIVRKVSTLSGVRHNVQTRVLLSKSLHYSKVQFLARFTPVPPKILIRKESKIKRYLENSVVAVLNKTDAVLPVDDEGLGAMDLSLQI